MGSNLLLEQLRMTSLEPVKNQLLQPGREIDQVSRLRFGRRRRASEKSIVKPEALEALHYVAMAGPVDRSRFIAMTGLGERTGRRVLASLLDYGVLSAESSRSQIAFAVPLKSLKHLFPSLWP